MANVFRVELSETGNLDLVVTIGDNQPFTLVSDLTDVDIIGLAPDNLVLMTSDTYVRARKIIDGLLTGKQVFKKDAIAVMKVLK